MDYLLLHSVIVIFTIMASTSKGKQPITNTQQVDMALVSDFVDCEDKLREINDDDSEVDFM